MKSSPSKEVSEYFRNLAKRRKDNNRGFNDPEVVRKAVETRKKNAQQKAKDKPTQKES